MRLDAHRFEDLVSYLVVVGLRAHTKFDPAFGQSESTFLYRRMRPRVIDWIRCELGDNRQVGGGRGAFRRNLLTLDEMDPDEVPGSTPAWQSDEDAAEEWTQALERVGEGLTEEARETLMAVGLRLVDGESLRTMSEELGASRIAVSRRITRLREELAVRA